MAESDDPYRSPASAEPLDSAEQPPGRTPTPLQTAGIVISSLLLGSVTFFATCFGVGFVGVSAFGLYSNWITPTLVLAYTVGISFGVAVAFYVRRRMTRAVQSMESRSFRPLDGDDA